MCNLTLQACYFTKINSILDVFLRILKLWQSIIFRKIVICVEELNYMKDYMKVKIAVIACKFAVKRD